MRSSCQAVLVGFALLTSCTKDPEPPKSGNGINNVRLSCDIRAKWNRTGNDCSVCESGVITERCECSSLAAFSGACLEQEAARKKACSESVVNCVYRCVRDDCACIDLCYEQDRDPNCKAASDARDGCIQEACNAHCK